MTDYILVLSAFAATCLALIGKTTRESDGVRPWFRRITPIGYVAFLIAIVSMAAKVNQIRAAAAAVHVRQQEAVELVFDDAVTVGRHGAVLQALAIQMSHLSNTHDRDLLGGGGASQTAVQLSFA